MPLADCARAHLYFEDDGQGPPVVWLAGTGLRGSTWRLQTAEVSRTHRCISVDLPGSGRSTLPAEPTPRGMACDIADLVEHLDAGPVHLVGLSLGSAVAQEVALLRPDLVRSAALVDTWSSTSREHHIRLHFESRLYALERGPLDVFAHFAFWMSAPSIIDEEPELQALVEQRLAADTSPWPEGTASHFRADLAHETADRLDQISCPTVVIHGAEDLITLPRYNRAVARAIPGASNVEIPRAGHLVWLERPAEVTAALLDFLRAQPPRMRHDSHEGAEA